MGFTTATCIHQQQLETIKLTTGCEEVDKILGGESPSQFPVKPAIVKT